MDTIHMFKGSMIFYRRASIYRRHAMGQAQVCCLEPEKAGKMELGQLRIAHRFARFCDVL